MEVFKTPKGAVKFAIGSIDKLPFNAEEVELYMVSGDPTIYIVPVSEKGLVYKSFESIISDFDLKI